MRFTNPKDNHFCIWFGDEFRFVFIELENVWEKDIGIHFIGSKWFPRNGIRWIRRDGLMLEVCW